MKNFKIGNKFFTKQEFLSIILYRYILVITEFISINYIMSSNF